MNRLLSLILLAALPLFARAELLNPDQLLERIRSERVSEQQAMQQREQQFLAERAEQARLRAEARAALAVAYAELSALLDGLTPEQRARSRTAIPAHRALLADASRLLGAQQ